MVSPSPVGSPPVVTIGVPTLRRVQLLAEAVESALAQTYAAIEILISQDVGPTGPDPRVTAFAQEISRRDARVRWQCATTNLGLAGNWNFAADHARGAYLVLMGDDDRLLPTFVEQLMKAADGDDAVVFSNHYVIDEHGVRLERESRQMTEHFNRGGLADGVVADPERLVWRNAVPMTSALVRTDLVRRLRFREELNTPEIELYARIAHEGGRFRFVSDYLAEYRTHNQSATSDGLRLDRLVLALLPLPVSPSVVEDKRQLIRSFLPGAVELALRAGDTTQARRLLATGLSPGGSRMALHQVIARLPASIAGPCARAVRRAGRLGKSLTRWTTA
jgi:GT2 family glycosyltransferase